VRIFLNSVSKHIILIGFSFIAIYLSSCGSSEFYPIPDSELLLYEVGDTLVYQYVDTLDVVSYDTFLVDSIAVVFNDYVDYFGLSKQEESYEKRTYYFGKTNGEIPYSQTDRIVKSFSSNFYIMWKTRDDFIGTETNVPYSNLMTPFDTIINGEDYSNVYYFDVDTIGMTSDRVIRIYYNDNWGILRYEYLKGKIWEIIPQ